LVNKLSYFEKKKSRLEVLKHSIFICTVFLTASEFKFRTSIPLPPPTFYRYDKSESCYTRRKIGPLVTTKKFECLKYCAMCRAGKIHFEAQPKTDNVRFTADQTATHTE